MSPAPGEPTPAATVPGASALRERVRRLVREVAKFGAVGGAGVLVNLAVFNLVRHLTELQVVRASVLATVVAIVFNYLGFRYFTYRDRDKGGRTREMSLFLAFSVIGLVIENGILYTGTYGLGFDGRLESNVLKFAGIGVATLFRFWSYRTWVFRAPAAVRAAKQATEPVREPVTSGTSAGRS
ncbi:GtrA family protein [Streptomyces sp. DR3-1]|uniref:GtrA family protein n=1 Tax=Streptomyces sp. DR3-1 TaxID=2951169 RepID=UPI0020446D8E|nr:GtrA family protein [Streptomyces sp. DR3-1]MCM3819845.1 GtrA family protein [Streptomyces sp. DR3-1]